VRSLELAIKYLAGERLVGTAAERAALIASTSICVSATYSNDAKSLGGSSQFSNGHFLILCKIDTTSLPSTYTVGSISANFVANNGGTTTYKYACYNGTSSPTTKISESAEYVWDGVTGITSQDMTTTPTITNVDTLWLALAIKNTGVNGPDIQATTTGIGSGDSYHDLDDYDNWFPSSAPSTTGGSDPNVFVKLCAAVPTLSFNAPNGTIFEESDTGKMYMWDGTDTWNEM